MARGAGTCEVVVVSLVLLSCLVVSSSAAFNITKVLEPFPSFSQLNQWLTKTGVADEINNRSSITILAPANAVFQTYLNGVPTANTDPNIVGDTLRYNVLLQYFGMSELSQITGSKGQSVTTLLQTTGTANASEGFVSIYNNGTSYVVGHEYVDRFGNETILGNVTQALYNYSVLEVSAFLSPVPASMALPAPAPSPLAKAPAPAPKGATVPGEPAPVSPSKSHASRKSMSGPLLLSAILLASIVALR